jgi:hypothetical protein
VESCRMGHNLPLEVVVREPVAYLNFHWQQGHCSSGRVLRRGRLGFRTADFTPFRITR